MNVHGNTAEQDTERYVRNSSATETERSGRFDYKEIREIESGIERLVRGGREKELRAYLERISGRIDSEKIGTEAVRLLSAQLSASVLKILYTAAGEEQIRKFQNGRISLPYEHGASSAKQWENCKDFFLAAAELISGERRGSSVVLCRQALDVIQDRYDERDLSLAEVSREIAVSPNYLSTLLRKTTGKTFVDLLIEKRIDTAKELLTETDLKIREISELCGYSDQHYFSCSFKKVTGQSPKSWRSRSKNLNKTEWNIQ